MFYSLQSQNSSLLDTWLVFVCFFPFCIIILKPLSPPKSWYWKSLLPIYLNCFSIINRALLCFESSCFEFLTLTPEWKRSHPTHCLCSGSILLSTIPMPAPQSTLWFWFWLVTVCVCVCVHLHFWNFFEFFGLFSRFCLASFGDFYSSFFLVIIFVLPSSDHLSSSSKQIIYHVFTSCYCIIMIIDDYCIFFYFFERKNVI